MPATRTKTKTTGRRGAPRTSPRTAAKPTPETTSPEWVGSIEAARIIGRDPRVVARLARGGFIRTHRPPGSVAKYFRPDVEKHAPEAVLAQS